MRSRIAWLVLWTGLSACAYEPIGLRDEVDGSDGATEGGLTDRDLNEAGLTDHEMEDAGDSDADAGDGGENANAADDAGPDADGSMPDSDGSLIDADDPDALYVEPLFPAAPRWNDHVVNVNQTSPVVPLAMDLPRDAAACLVTTPYYNAFSCFHAGEARKLELVDESSCAGLSAVDARGWFDWRCEDGSGHVVLVATLLRSGLTVRDLIDLRDLAQPRVLTNVVTVTRGQDVVATTPPHAFWSNPVVVVDGGASVGVHQLNVEGAIYIVTEPLNADLSVMADHVTVLAVDGVTVVNDQFRSTPLLEANGRAFLWLEGLDLDVTGRTTGVSLNVTRSVLRDIKVDRSGVGPGMDVDLLLQASSSSIERVSSERASADGIELRGASNFVRDIHSYDAGARGLVLLADNTIFERVHVQRASGTGVFAVFHKSDMDRVDVASCGGHGVHLQGSDDCDLLDITSHNNGGAGLLIEPSSADPGDSKHNTVSGVVTTNNGTAGLSLRGVNQTVAMTISANNATDGIEIRGGGNLVLHATVANNGNAGIQTTTDTTNTSLINVVAINNRYGVRVESDVVDAQWHDTVAAHNEMDVQLEGEGSVFSGVLMLTDNASCYVAPSLTSAGLSVGPPCAPIGDSSAVIGAPTNLSQAFVGMVAAGDMANGSYDLLEAPQGTVLSPLIDDWITFSVPQRHWGKFALAAYPGADFAGTCQAPNDRCVVWDWRVRAGSTLKDVFAGSQMMTLLNDPIHQRVHTWSASNQTICQGELQAQWDGSRCTSRFLAFALQDRNPNTRGNANLLCEAMEGCVLNRNRGGYFGEGALELSGVDEVVGFGDVNLQRHVTAGP